MPSSNRRRLKRGQPIDKIIRANQIRRFNAGMDRDAAQIDRTLTHMANRVRTLKLDEHAKAKLAVADDGSVTIRTTSAAQLCAESAVLNEWTTIEERPETHIIPRRSLTERLFLRLFKPVMQFEDVPFRTLDQTSRDTLADIAKQIRRAHPDNREAFRDKLMETFVPIWVEGTNPELRWKSAETLLNPVKPDKLATVSVTFVNPGEQKKRSFETESDDLPTWDDTTPRTWDDTHNTHPIT